MFGGKLCGLLRVVLGACLACGGFIVVICLVLVVWFVDCVACWVVVFYALCLCVCFSNCLGFVVCGFVDFGLLGFVDLVFVVAVFWCLIVRLV